MAHLFNTTKFCQHEVLALGCALSLLAIYKGQTHSYIQLHHPLLIKIYQHSTEIRTQQSI